MPPDKELKNCRISHTFILCYFNHPFCKLSKKRFLFFSNFSVLFAEACAGMVAFSSVRGRHSKRGGLNRPTGPMSSMENAWLNFPTQHPSISAIGPRSSIAAIKAELPPPPPLLLSGQTDRQDQVHPPFHPSFLPLSLACVDCGEIDLECYIPRGDGRRGTLDFMAVCHETS